jgi:hypothetical protein
VNPRNVTHSVMHITRDVRSNSLQNYTRNQNTKVLKGFKKGIEKIKRNIKESEGSLFYSPFLGYASVKSFGADKLELSVSLPTPLSKQPCDL